MAKKILKSVKFHNSIRLANTENHYYSGEKFDISLDGIIVRVQDKRSGEICCSSLMNTISFVPDEKPQDMLEISVSPLQVPLAAEKKK